MKNGLKHTLKKMDVLKLDNILVREATLDDLDEVALAFQEYAKTFTVKGSNFTFLASHIIKLRESGIFLAFYRQRLIGFVTYMSNFSFTYTCSAVVFEDFWVNKEYRHDKIPEMIFRRCMDLALQSGVNHIYTHIAANDYVRQRYLRRYGFETTHYQLFRSQEK